MEMLDTGAWTVKDEKQLLENEEVFSCDIALVSKSSRFNRRSYVSIEIDCADYFSQKQAKMLSKIKNMIVDNKLLLTGV